MVSEMSGHSPFRRCTEEAQGHAWHKPLLSYLTYCCHFHTIGKVENIVRWDKIIVLFIGIPGESAVRLAPVARLLANPGRGAQ